MVTLSIFPMPAIASFGTVCHWMLCEPGQGVEPAAAKHGRHVAWRVVEVQSMGLRVSGFGRCLSGF